MTPRLAVLTALVAAFALLGGSAHAQIVDHPDKLTYPTLTYAPPRAADSRVVLPGGVVAYLVPDRSVPMVNVQIIWRTNGSLDPQGKEGLSDFATGLLAKGGTKTRTATQFEDRVAYLGATLATGPGGASLNLLAKDTDEGLGLLRECLTAPRWQDDRITLLKDQELAEIKTRNDDSPSIESREFGFLLRGEQHWSNRYTTVASVNALSAADFEAFRAHYIGPKNFMFAVSGDFDKTAMTKKLTTFLAGWPTTGERPPTPPAPTQAAAKGWYFVDKDVNQCRVSIAVRGVQRDDPDYFAELVMNDILGGGGFTSRLVNRIRSDEGLAYSAGSSQSEGVYYAEPWRMAFQSKVRSTAFAIQIAMEEAQRIRDSLVTDDELTTTKRGFIEAYPNRFSTPAQIASALASEEWSGRYVRDPEYFARYRDRVDAVTKADVQRVARRVITPENFCVLLVGKKSDILLGDPKHDASIEKLADGKITYLPLRDPATMKPLP